MPNKSGHPSKMAMPAFGAFSSNNASMLLEKSHPGLRRSTPDSEAMASSDDEVEQHRSVQPISGPTAQKPLRRTSWLNEIPSSTRKSSVTTTTTPYSPTTSHPATPSGDSSTWGTAGSPSLGAAGAWNSSSSTSYPWGGIWNNDGRKDPPSRLQEVLPSPTAINVPIAGFLNENSPLTSFSRGNAGDSAIPFSIPLHPTPKTYRSQSYSVGQLDPESLSLASSTVPDLNVSSRGRGNGLVRRTSRPSGLGDRGHDAAVLGRVREVEDDEEHEDQLEAARNEEQARKIEQLTKENAWLRQKQQEQSARDRTASSTSAASGSGMTHSPTEISRLRGALIGDSDLAVDDYDESNYGSAARDNFGPRYSKHSTPDTDRQHLSSISNIDNVKRNHWQTSLGFETVVEPPQSRRHSFADVPTRHGSISTTTDTYAGTSAFEPQNGRQTREEGYGTFGEGAQEMSHGDYRKSSPTQYSRLEEQRMELEHYVFDILQPNTFQDPN